MANETAAQDRIPLLQKFIYGLGAFVNNLLSGAIGNMAIVLNLGLAMNPAIIGTIMAGARLVDAFSDPVIGYVSDQTQTKWGRRRPFIVGGAIFCGIIFALMWQIPSGASQSFYTWFFVLGTTLLYVGTSIFAIPFIALGYEMTPDYRERTRIQGFGNFIGQIPWILLPWSYAFMENKSLFHDSVQGARVLAIIVGAVAIALGVLPGIYCREPFYKIAKKEAKPLLSGVKHKVAEFAKGIGYTMKNRDFLRLAMATFLVFNGFMLIAGLGAYVIIFYVCGGDKALGARYVGEYGTAMSICTFAAIAASTWFATHLGKKPAFILCTAISIFGYALKWFCYVPNHPNYLLWTAPFISFGLGGLFVTISAMIADVCDQDELQNGSRREASFGAIYWWMVKLGMALALAASGYLLNATGFDQALGANQSARSLFLMRVFEIGLPIFFYVIAIVGMLTYDLSQEKMTEIRAALEKRRGATAAA